MEKPASGLQYEDTQVGNGASPQRGQTCQMHYTGWLWENGAKGKKFDSSLDRGQPFAFPLGMGRVIKGWDEGVASMKVGGKRALLIPPGLGYGDRGAGGVVPGGATLQIEVELLGLVQGLTEYIPVASTAHLRVMAALVGRADDGAAYTAVLQLGTLAAVLIYFAKDLAHMPAAMFRDWHSPEGRLPWLIALGSIPIVIAGLLLKKHVEGDLRSLYIIASALVIIGIAMALIGSRTLGDRTVASVTWQDALLIGLAQTLALIPG